MRYHDDLGRTSCQGFIQNFDFVDVSIFFFRGKGVWECLNPCLARMRYAGVFVAPAENPCLRRHSVKFLFLGTKNCRDFSRRTCAAAQSVGLGNCAAEAQGCTVLVHIVSLSLHVRCRRTILERELDAMLLVFTQMTLKLNAPPKLYPACLGCI